jgi:hypothetical protein
MTQKAFQQYYPDDLNQPYPVFTIFHHLMGGDKNEFYSDSVAERTGAY